MPGDHEPEPELQNIAKHETHDKRQYCGVHPEDRHVRKAKEPGTEEAVVAAERLRRVCIRSAGARTSVDHAVVVPRDDEHHGSTDDDADRCPKRPRFRQKRRPRQDERVPAEGASERERPGCKGRYAGCFHLGFFPLYTPNTDSSESHENLKSP